MLVQIESTLRLKGKEGVEIKAILHYDESDTFDDGDIWFKHVLTGDYMQTVDQVLHGWSEHDRELQKDWKLLVEAIKRDRDLTFKMFDEMEVIEYAPVKFYINYNTGAGNDWEATFEKAKETAMFGSNYTGKNITIENENGGVLACLPWHNYPPTEDDTALIEYGNFGFYGDWESVSF